MSQDLVNPYFRATVVAALPLSGSAGQVVQLSTTGQLYRWHQTAWSPISTMSLGLAIALGST